MSRHRPILVLALLGTATCGAADQVAIVPLPEDPDHNLVVGRFSSPIGWPDAADLIEAVDADWFVPTTFEEQMLVGSTASSLGPWECVGPWLGAVRPAAAGPIIQGWATPDGIPLNTTAWASDAPTGAPILRWVAALDGRDSMLLRWINLLPGEDAGPGSFGIVATIPANLPDCDGDGVPDAIEELWLDSLTCDDTCPADFNADGTVDAADLGQMLTWFGRTCRSTSRCTGDLNRDGRIDGADLGRLFIAWGPCP